MQKITNEVHGLICEVVTASSCLENFIEYLYFKLSGECNFKSSAAADAFLHPVLFLWCTDMIHLTPPDIEAMEQLFYG